MAEIEDSYQMGIKPDRAGEAALDAFIKSMGELVERIDASGEAEVRAQKKAQDAAKEQKKRAEDSRKSFDKFAKTLKVGVVGGFGAVTAAGAATFAMLSKANAEALKLSQEGGEQAELNQRLYDSIRRRTSSVEEANRVYAEQNKVINDLSLATGLTDEALSAASEQYIRLTDKQSASTKDFSIIAGIARAKKQELSQAAEVYAKALKGEIGPLMDLTSLTKAQIDALNKETDESKRAAIAQGVLAEQYEGTAEQVDKGRLAHINHTNALGDLRQVMGQVINSSGVMEAVYGPLTKAVRDQEKAVGDNTKAYQRFVIDGVNLAITGFRGALEIGRALAVFYTNFKTGLIGLKFTFKAMGLFAVEAFEGIEDSAVEMIANGIDPVLRALDTLLDVYSGIAHLAGFSELESDLQSARAGIREFQKESAGAGDAARASTAARQEALNAELAKGRREIEASVQATRDMESGFKKVDAVLGKMQGNLAVARQTASGDLGPDTSRARGGNRAAARAVDPKAPARKKAAEDALALQQKMREAAAKEFVEHLKISHAAEQRLEAQRKEAILQDAANQAIQLRLGALRMEEGVARDIVEITAQRIEVQAQAETGADKRLELARLEVAEQQILHEQELARYESTRSFLASTQIDLTSIYSPARQQLLNQQMERTNELRSAESEHVKTAADLERERAESQMRQMREQARLQQEQAKAIGDTLTGTTKLAASIVDLTSRQWDFAKASESAISGLQAGVGIASGLTSIFVKDVKERAKWEAAINAAAAVAAGAGFWASGNPAYLAAAAGFGTAAVQHGIIAGTSTSAPSVSGGGASARTAAPQAPRQDPAQQRENARIMGEEIARASGARQDQAININMYDTMALGQSSESADQLAEYLVPAITTRLRSNR